MQANTNLPPPLRDHQQRIMAKALQFGLDPFDVIFKVLDFDTMNQIAAFGGFPTRYPHWKWGMEYERISKRDAYGMGRIYEMVINNDPSYAYLQESNAVIDQKLVMAHVYAHSDFFKNNLWFSKTNRKMMDQMANHAIRVQRHVDKQGREDVERFIDTCLRLEHLIDPHSMFLQRGATAEQKQPDTPFEPARLPAKDYMDPYINPKEVMAEQRVKHEQEIADQRGKFPARPMRDVLAFLLEHAKLDTWQHDILSLIRDEAYYFAPQAMTKIMNEGWATYWHSKLMTEYFIEPSEIIDYADQHSGVVYMGPGSFNPYKIGVEMFKDIERRWDRGQFGPEYERLEGLGEKKQYDTKLMQGRRKIFEVRTIYNDVDFIDEFLTPQLVEKLNLYQYRRDPHTGQMRIVTRDFQVIKQTLLYRISNMSQPFIYAVDGNYANRGELYLAHQWNGLDLDLAKAQEVLEGVERIWGRPVHIQCRVNDEMLLVTHDGKEPKRQRISDDLPKPAHVIT
ncbi:MAG: SpoVR family protein [Phycisphaerales bacterium]|nr:SpoVR family protein [Phycisphaerales bacterium]